MENRPVITLFYLITCITIMNAYSASAPRPGLTEIAGNHPHLKLTGRFQTTPDNALLFAWSGSRITMQFNGTAVNVTLRDLNTREEGETEGNYLLVLLDENPPVALKLNSGLSTYQLAKNLSPGDHTITLFKQTEPLVGSVALLGFTIINGTSLPPHPKPDRRIEFYGDSITCGFGNEGRSETESFKPSTENHYLSYVQITTRNLNAECHVVAWSGEGLIRNSQGKVIHPLPSIYDLILPPDDASVWDFSDWIPHVVVINLGTNDFLTGIPDREQFIDAYLTLLESLYRHYNRPHVICCLGPLLNDGETPEELKLTTAQNYLQEMIKRAEKKGMDTIHMVEFNQLENDERGSLWHPNISAHRRMADELTRTISQTIGW